ncbi:hypothetical protein [Salinicola aestuarinus]|uniref:hypothetical protein n=1 Tax=Salinicola aestuarinus TaxID=1949082 RepID=UPI000DA1512D|nr:hypothetical protein [Salinicola aestuarinus]
MSIRAVLYILALAALAQAALVIDACRAGGPDFSEVSFTEITQALLLLSASLLMVYMRQCQRMFPTAALLLGGLFFASFIRENDMWLDTYVFDGSWQVLVTLVTLPALVIAIVRRQQLLSELRQLTDSLGFGLFAGGFLITYLFSRLYGRSELWHALMREDYLRVVKDAAEEITEMSGYALMLFGCLEMVLLARRVQRARQVAHAR